MKKYIALALFLSLVGCNNDENGSNTTKTKPDTSVTKPDTSVIELTINPEFRVKKGTRVTSDQLSFNVVKTTDAELKVYDKDNVMVSERKSSSPASEHTFNIGSTYDSTGLKYGKYSYELSTSLPDGTAEKVFKGSFEKILRPIHTFENKISDISIFGDTLYVATGDYSKDVEVTSINIETDAIT